MQLSMSQAITAPAGQSKQDISNNQIHNIAA
jgi:hypothetical protein